MATLTGDEMWRVRAELGDNVLSVSASPYIGVRSVWSVIQANVTSSSVLPTTTSTSVSAAGPATLTLASVTGYVAGQSVQIDTDAERETCTIRAVSGVTISVNCRKAHGGTYTVEVESALTIVRGIVADLRRLEQGDMQTAFGALGVRRVDEIEFNEEGSFKLIERARNSLRSRLANACGVGQMYGASTSTMEVY